MTQASRIEAASAGKELIPGHGELRVEKNAPAGHEARSAEERARNRKINQKMDIALLPLLALLYLFNGLDRGNVGNAQTQGMKTARILRHAHPYFADGAKGPCNRIYKRHWRRGG